MIENYRLYLEIKFSLLFVIIVFDFYQINGKIMEKSQKVAYYFLIIMLLLLST